MGICDLIVELWYFLVRGSVEGLGAKGVVERSEIVLIAERAEVLSQAQERLEKMKIVVVVALLVGIINLLLSNRGSANAKRHIVVIGVTDEEISEKRSTSAAKQRFFNFRDKNKHKEGHSTSCKRFLAPCERKENSKSEK